MQQTSNYVKSVFNSTQVAIGHLANAPWLCTQASRWAVPHGIAKPWLLQLHNMQTAQNHMNRKDQFLKMTTD